MSKAAGLCALLAFVVIACEPEPDVEPIVCKNSTPAVAEVGAGDLKTGFVEVDDGDDARLILGPQGLHMIVVSVRLPGFEAPAVGGQPTRISISIRQDGEDVGGVTGDLPPTSVDSSMTQFIGLRATFTTAEIEPLLGRHTELAATIVDGCGREIRGDLDVVLYL